jgi:hypothetical protein
MMRSYARPTQMVHMWRRKTRVSVAHWLTPKCNSCVFVRSQERPMWAYRPTTPPENGVCEIIALTYYVVAPQSGSPTSIADSPSEV